MRIYLAGAIAGCSIGEANDWRDAAIARLALHGITGISPLRCEPPVNGRYGELSGDPKFGTARAIASKNLLDVDHCDVVLAYLPKPPDGRRVSVGTVIEIGWAHAMGKPVILVTDDPALAGHPLVNFCSAWLLASLDEAIELLVGLLRDYTR
jgi:nucleoside 2-deoxyribosyltransferase